MKTYHYYYYYYYDEWENSSPNRPPIISKAGKVNVLAQERHGKSDREQTASQMSICMCLCVFVTVCEKEQASG